MQRNVVILVVLSLIASSFGFATGGSEQPRSLMPSGVENIDVLLGSYFTLNAGQVREDDVILHSRSAYFTPSSVLFRLNNDGVGYVFEVSFVGANRIVPRGEGRLPFDNNYFIGNDPAGWRTGVPNFREVVYEGLYDGVDLVFRATPVGTKYEFVVHPGGDVADIALAFDGASISTDGNALLIETPLGLVVDGGLEVYQDRNAPLDARFEIEDGKAVYKVDNRRYDPYKDLVIDPLIFSTFFGGGATDSGFTLALDKDNNMYITGTTTSTNLPTTVGAVDASANGAVDAFVLALNASGKDLIYVTYYGGTSSETAFGIAVDSSKNAYVTGETYSLNLPTTVGAYDTTFTGNVDDFVFKLNPTGTALVYSTYVGGTSHDTAYCIVVDGSGAAYVTGYTWSTNFPTKSAYSTTNKGQGDISVFKLNAAGNDLVFSTFIGGIDYDYGYSIDIDPNRDVYVTGRTASNNDFPTTGSAYDTSFNGGQFDIFVLKLNSSGSSLDYSTFVGGSNSELFTSIDVDSAGNAFVCGQTISNNFPTTPGAYDTSYGGGDDGFLFKLNKTGGAMDYSMFVGGNTQDYATDVAVDGAGNAYVTGSTFSANFPTSPGAYCSTYGGGGNSDAFIFAVNATGKGLIYSSFYGGTGSDDGNGIALDAAKIIYITGYTGSADFPVTQGSYSTVKNASLDVFALKMKIPLPPDAPQTLKATAGDSYVLLNWSRPSDDGGSKVTGFRVYRGLTPAALASQMSIGNVTDYNDTTVTNGVTYYYAVAAKNVVGEGAASNVVDATPTTTPVEPTGLKVKIGDRFVNLTWSPPADSGGLPIMNYRIHRGFVSTSLSALSLIGNQTAYNDTTVTNGVTYYYAVSALNLRGEGPRSTNISAKPGKIPSMPLNLSAEIGDGLVALDWDNPQDTGGYALTGFKIFKEGPGLPRVLLDQVASPGYNDTSVENGRTYNYSVSASNSLGEGAACPNVQAKPGRTPEGPVLTLQSGDGRVDLAWVNGGDGGYQVSTFRVYRGFSADPLVFLSNTTDKWYNDTSVENGRTYYYAVSAMNALGEGPRSTVLPAYPKGLPDSPRNQTAVVGNGFVVVSWLPPADTGGVVITGYKLYKGTKADGTDLALLKELTTLNYTDAAVTNKATYYYAVSALNEVGEGVKTTLVPATPLGLPGKVKALMAKEGDDFVLLGWMMPDDDGGSPILGFRVFRGTTLLSEVASPALNDTAVKNGMKYEYSVAAFSKMGEGEMSKVTATPAGRPGAPANLSAVRSGSWAQLSWDPPEDMGGLWIEEYKIYRGTSPDDMVLVGKTSTMIDAPSHEGCSYLDKDVKGGKTYYYRVSAGNSVGDGPRSGAVSVKVKAPSAGLGGMLLYLLLAVVAMVIVAVVVAVLIMKRKKGAAPASAPLAPAPQQPQGYPEQQQQQFQSPGWEAGQQPPTPPPQ